MLSTADFIDKPPPPTDTIYVAGIPVDTDEAAIAKHFSQIGVIKKDRLTNKDRIYIYKDADGTKPLCASCAGFATAAFLRCEPHATGPVGALARPC